MSGSVLFARDVGGTRRQARLDEADLVQLQAHLEEVPGGLSESPSAAEALKALDEVTSPGDVHRAVLSDGAADAIHWALERMMAADLELSSEMHNLRCVVVPDDPGEKRSSAVVISG
jgi:hypothetical protein